jgi:amino acid permease
MKFIAVLLGLVCLAVAAAYFVVPAGSLPGFFPGFEAGGDRIHVKHGVAALAAAVVLFGFAWWRGRTA